MSPSALVPPEPVATHTANPAPLGLAGFAVTTILLSSINAGFIPEASVAAVVPLAFAYGGIGQVITGVLEFRNGNTFGTAAYSSFGLFWIWYALLQWTVGAGWLKAPPPEAIGAALLIWGIFAFGLWLGTFRTNFVVWTMFLALWVTFFLLAAANFGMPTGSLGGWTGLVLGGEALYLSIADILKAMYGRQTLPVGKAPMAA